MGKLAAFKILVNSCDGVVKAGGTVAGQVVLELSDDLQVNEVRINFAGLSSTQWTEGQKPNPIPEMNAGLMDPVLDQEVYFNKPLTLWRADTTGTSTNSTSTSATVGSTLTKGAHTMDFVFHVPDSSPSSFQGKNGFVHYMLKATVEMPARRRVRETRVTINSLTVVSDLNLNDVSEARDSVHLSRDLLAKTLLSSVDCHATLRLEKKGFTQGETIPVQFAIHNNSSHAIHNASLLLKMFILYRAGDSRCESECVLAQSHLGRVRASKTLEGLDQKLRVPVTCQPSGLPGCRLIDIKYRVELKIKPTSLSFQRLRLHTDVIVGTTPLTPTSYQDSPPDYWSCCLPSYEDIMALGPPPYSPQASPTPALYAPTRSHPDQAVSPHRSAFPVDGHKVIPSTKAFHQGLIGDQSPCSVL